MRNAVLVIGAVLVGLLLALAVFAPLLSPVPPEAQDILARFQPPGAQHPLGTDNFGRDLLARI
ncbi:MAG: ABC transporter permease, partial [Proteobacteria bacterium]|nr:ABC transporter permease [Pseudomonadota bacterium]